MTKYHELCEAYALAKKNYQEYLNDCHLTSKSLWKAIIGYFEMPEDRIKLFNINEYGEAEETKSSLKDHLFLRNDGFFELTIGISLCDSKKAQEQETIILPLQIAIDEESVQKIRLSEYGSIYIVDRKKPASFQDFLDSIFTSITESYRKGLKEIRSNNSQRTIGFQS